MKTERSIEKEARVAGLRAFVTPTLEAIERRRWQLWMIAAFLMISLAAGAVLLSTDSSAFSLITRYLPLYVVRVLFVGFTALVALYLVDRESRLRKITHRLIDERVLSAALSNRLKEVLVLSEAGQAMNRLLDLNETLRIILDSALELLEAEEGSVMLVESDGDKLAVAASRTSSEHVKDAVIKLGQGVAGWVAERREPILIAGNPPEGLFEEFEAKDRRIASALSVPLLSRNELQGVLNVNDLTGKRSFSEYDLRALQLFAEHAADAIRNAIVYEKEKSAVARMEEVDRMKTEFVATITHELRTPLTSILGAAKTMRTRGHVLDDEQRLEMLEVIDRQGERLLRLIEDVLSASRIETTGVARLRRRKLELVSIAEAVIKGERSAGVSSPIELEAPPTLEVFGDPMAIEQILTNLIDNAVKYSAAGQPITVRLSDRPSDVLMEVEDRGIGIPEDVLPAIFDRFRQADQSMTRPIGGVGLGLYIVKNLVGGMGGEVSVVSEEGRGSKFSVSLPRRRS
jgi:signal transduction histidine kinase